MRSSRNVTPHQRRLRTATATASAPAARRRLPRADDLPIKYYRPAGGAPINNGPYQGNLGDYLSPFREDNDNPVAPAWFAARQTSDPAGAAPLADPKTGVTVPLAGYDANRFFGVDSAGLDPQWYHLDGFIAGGDWESPTPL